MALGPSYLLKLWINHLFKIIVWLSSSAWILAPILYLAFTFELVSSLISFPKLADSAEPGESVSVDPIMRF